MSSSHPSIRNLRQRSSPSPTASGSPIDGRQSPSSTPRGPSVRTPRFEAQRSISQTLNELTPELTDLNVDRIKTLLSHCNRRLRQLNIPLGANHKGYDFDRVLDQYDKAENSRYAKDSGVLMIKHDSIGKQGEILKKRRFLMESALSAVGDPREFSRRMTRILEQLERDPLWDRSPASSQGGTPTASLNRCFDIVSPFEDT